VDTTATAQRVAVRNTYANCVYNFLETQLFYVSAEVSITAHSSEIQWSAVDEHSTHTNKGTSRQT